MSIYKYKLAREYVKIFVIYLDLLYIVPNFAKAKAKHSFVIANVHYSIQENEVKEELLNNNAMNAIKVLRITSRATGKPTKLIRVLTDCSNHVTAAIKHGVKIGWVLHRCKPSKELPHIKQCFNCEKFGHSASDCKGE